MKKKANDTDQHVLLSYLEGKLSGDERYEVEQQLLRDPAAKVALEGLQTSGLSYKQLQDDGQAIRASWYSAKREPATASGNAWWSRAAAVVLLFIVAWAAWGYYQDQQPNNLYASYFADSNQKEDYQAIRGEETTLAGFAPAVQAYQEQNYELSFSLFQQLREEHPFNGLILRYAAMSAMQLGDFYVAEQALLQSLSVENTNAERAAAHWYLALVYLRINEEDKARQHLQALSTAGAGVYTSQAAKLLVDLD